MGYLRIVGGSVGNYGGRVGVYVRRVRDWVLFFFRGLSVFLCWVSLGVAKGGVGRG